MILETRGIIFDFFGVFCAEVARHWYKNHTSPYSYEELREKYIVPYDKGEISAQKAWEALGVATNTTGEQVRDEWLALAQVDPGMVALVEELKTHYSVALCSNGNADFFWAIADKEHLRGLFPITVISSDEKAVKPDPEIYQRTLNRMELAPEHVVFIDDRPENLAPAQVMGMRTIHFVSLADLRKKLEEFAVL